MLDKMDITDFKFIIVGAGVCGALAAYKLSKKHKVLLLEAGPDQLDRVQLAGQFATAVNKGPGSPYSKVGPGDLTGPDNERNYYQTTADPFRSTFLRIAGGSTWHFLGNVPRFVPDDFRMKECYGRGVDWPITYDELEPYYCEAEHELGVSGDHETWNGVLGAYRSRPYPMSKIWQSYGDQLFLDSLKDFEVEGMKIDLLPTPQARNSTIYDGRPACAGNSTCVPICPIQAKYDATVHIKKAIAQGTVLVPYTIVSKLLRDENGTITELEFVNAQTKEKGKLDVTGKIIVLAAHAIEIPRLMLNSNLATKRSQIGKNLMDHLQGYCVGLSPNPIYPFRGPITTSGIDVFRNGDHRKQFAAFRMSIGNDGWGRIESPFNSLWNSLSKDVFGDELVKQVTDRVTRMVRISFSTEMLPEEHNSVTTSSTLDSFGIPRPTLNFHFDQYNKDALKFAYGVSKSIFKKAVCQVEEPPEITKQFDSNGNFILYAGAGHIVGTTRMGRNATDSVVDSYGKVHEHKNLYITGPSVFPTSGTANPTLTAAALTIRTTETLMQL